MILQHKQTTQLKFIDKMGITNFYGWVKNQYSKSIKTSWLNSYDYVYIDLNYALHYVASSLSANESDLIYEKLYEFISSVLQITQPKKSLVLATDGVPPISKLSLQRKRRLDRSNKMDDSFNTIQFTPNTKFMESLAKKMKVYFDKITLFYNVPVKLLFGKNDESEIKIKSAIMKSFDENPDDTHIVASNDADTIVLLTGAKKIEHLHNIFVLNKSRFETITISLGVLIYEHTAKFGRSKHPHLDFIACTLFLGNDYIPKVAYLNSMKLWMSYKDTITNLIPSGLVYINNGEFTINKIFLIKLLYKFICCTKQDIFKLNDKNNNDYYNYFDGYIWCIDMYINGKCSKYNYFYNKINKIPHPFAMIIALNMVPNLLKLKTFATKNKNNKIPLNSSLYSILVMPKKQLGLLSENMKTYDKFIASHKTIYKIENCEKCENFKKQLSDELDIKKEFDTHKKTHIDISENDIINLNKNFKKYCSNL